ncbi:hypothetical protein [Kribbella solani]|uniref:Uncharacterized protein n=1 Tax=Kribbella solani TaxID=236067 RepID=A0A841DWD4_9ACTN|nr:hypothetical protein [Kribbella solani]MBB5982429.1 hypothetical protein [Kribbella solani]
MSITKNKCTIILAGYAVVATVVGTILLVQPRTPQPCLDALDSADSGFAMAAGAVSSARRLDAYGVTYYAGQINQLAPTYNEQKAACRDAK